jgi:hypothetical protein
MTRFRRQTVWGVFYLVLFSTGAIYLWVKFSARINQFSFLSGWGLFALMLVLAGYNVRKKLPFLPMGTSENWLQFHIYGGWLSVVLFAIHLGFKLPNGWFELTLGTLYLVVAVSGVLGLFLSRFLPRRLTTRGGEVIFEQIPTIRRHIQEQAQTLALAALPLSGSSGLADFYVDRLKDFFESPPAFFRQLMGDRRSLNEIIKETGDLKRFLAPVEREHLEKLTELAERKDRLDFHYVGQLTLKLWLFVHIPFTYSLLLFTLAHIVLVYSFTGKGS